MKKRVSMIFSVFVADELNDVREFIWKRDDVEGAIKSTWI